MRVYEEVKGGVEEEVSEWKKRIVEVAESVGIDEVFERTGLH